MPVLRRPEILAPAGDAACLEAAVRAGADAVYFGLTGWNARARAENFDAAALDGALRTLHAAGVKGYVTLNTLVFDAELAGMEAAIRACAAAGADAVIVQDVGVARLVRAVAPDLPLHASTQMTCTDAGSVELARELGASRVILARELSLDDVGALRRETGVDVEVFVHGALCVAYSGQCLTSEALGGRSANRGACAQACRLPYELVVDGALRPRDDAAYLLSPEDLEASALVPRLIELGVAALKIEGRMKGPAYVAATTRLYRSAVDAALGLGPAPEARAREVALQMFSRGSGPGFLAGVDHQRLVDGQTCDHRGTRVGTSGAVVHDRGRAWVELRASAPIERGDGLLVEGGFAGSGEVGGRVWAVQERGVEVERGEAGRDLRVWLGPDVDVERAGNGHRVWKTSDPRATRDVEAATDRAPHRVRVDVSVRGRIGEPPLFEATTERGATARVLGDTPVERATSRAVGAAELRDKLGKLGDTRFSLGDLTLAWPEDAIVPLSSVNRARRALVAALEQAPHTPWRTTDAGHVELVAAATPPARTPAPGGLFVLARTLPQALAAAAAGAGVWLDFLELTGTGAAVRALRERGASFVGVAPPRIRKPGEEKIDHYLASLAPDGVLVRGLGALREAPTPGALRIGDFALNVTNRLAASTVLARDLDAFTPAFDLDAAQLCALLDSPFAPWAEVVVHHPMPLFHMEHCVIAALLSEGRDHLTCGRPCDRHQVSLRDRVGVDHPVEADVGCRNTVFHAASQSAAGVVGALRQSGVRRFRIELVRETPDDVTRLVATYTDLLAGRTSPADVWRTLRTESGYGVVRGSLRVV